MHFYYETYYYKRNLKMALLDQLLRSSEMQETEARDDYDYNSYTEDELRERVYELEDELDFYKPMFIWSAETEYTCLGKHAFTQCMILLQSLSPCPERAILPLLPDPSLPA